MRPAEDVCPMGNVDESMAIQKIYGSTICSRRSRTVRGLWSLGLLLRQELRASSIMCFER